MLAYAFCVLQEQAYKDVMTEEFENAKELLSAILCKGVSIQMKHGLEKSYISQEEALSTLRGKIEIQETIKTLSMQKKQFVCSYDECSVDTYCNRIIKTTLQLLLQADISKMRKNKIKRLLVYFSDISVLDISSIHWKLSYHKNQQTYRMLISVCQLVIQGLLQTQEDGTMCLMDFLDEQTMPKLYEKFIFNYFKQEHGGRELKISSTQIKWKLDDDMDKRLPMMQSDIVLSNAKTKKTLIIDAKYYANNMQQNYGKQTIHSANLYQIFTYVKNWKTEEGECVAGMLLYAQTDADVQPNQVYQMSGNAIYVQTLDLNCEFEKIRKQLDAIVQLVADL